jgi:hypothetical protein
MILALLAPLALAAEPSYDALASASWDTLTTKSNSSAGTVTLYKASLEDFECYRGSATVQGAPREKLIEVVLDIQSAVQWSSAGITEGRVLSHAGNRYEYYQYLNVPSWTMASDRFWFLYGTVETTATSTLFRWNRLTDGGEHKAVWDKVRAENPGAVEPPINVGSWGFTDASDGVVVDYKICSDSGGSMPTMVQNAASRKTLPDTIGDMVAEARRRATP